MGPAVAIVGLGLLAACTADPPPPPPGPRTGPPDLVLLWGHGETIPDALAAQALVWTQVWPVADSPEQTRLGAETGTWPGFPVRHRLTEVLRAVGYETRVHTSGELPLLPAPAADVPHFLAAESAGSALVTLVDRLAARPGWDHTLALVVDPTPGQPLLALGGALSPERRGQGLDGPVTVLDVLPTLLDAAGTVPPAGSPGRSLWGVVQGQAQPERVHGFAVGGSGDLSVRTAAWRLSWVAQGESGPALLQALAESALDGGRFRLVAAGTDSDVLAEHPDQAEALKAALVQWQLRAVQDPSGPPVDPALKAVLQQRGYW